MEENKGIRLNKYLSEAGICSRREADRLIEAGEVFVDGRRAVPGMKVLGGQQVVCRGRGVDREKAKPVLLAVNKPAGIVCTTSDKDRAPNIVDMVDYPERIYPIGRLDKDSEGLILMTNQGELVNKIMRGGNSHQKEYQVTVDKPVTEEFLKRMRRGVPILDTVTRPCFAEKTGERSFRLILTQGLNRQIRRMCEYLGYRVLSLKRVRIMNIRLGSLKPGAYRPVTPEEYQALTESIKGSSSLPYKDTIPAGRPATHALRADCASRKKGIPAGRPATHALRADCASHKKGIEKYGRYTRANHQIPRQKESPKKRCEESRDGRKNS